MAKKLRFVLVMVGVMIMVVTWGGVAAGAQEIDVVVIRARQGQYLVVAKDGEPRVDVAVIRARLGQYLETAWGGEPRIGEAFVRSVALTDQSPAGHVAAGAPVIGQSLFPGEAVARNLALASQPISEAFARSVALTGQSPAGHVAASGPVIGQSLFPGEA
ncbi:MAG: hypothetical protein GWN58_23590, partial [Anaerolineae bacterium]|nr:hypothetical protein [Anaerolineae bacterium]